MTTGKDRRRFSRFPFELPATIRLGGDKYATTILDLSLRGVLINRVNGFDAAPGDTVEISISFDNDAFTIDMEATVNHSDTTQIGLECCKIDIDSITHLRRLVELNLGDSSILDREFAELCKR